MRNHLLKSFMATSLFLHVTPAWAQTSPDDSSEDSEQKEDSDDQNETDTRNDQTESNKEESSPAPQIEGISNIETLSTSDSSDVSPDNASDGQENTFEFNPDEAQSLDTALTKEQIKWLQPTRGKLPQNPYQHVDFTAYTLEWGEIQAGLNRSTIGVLPRTQVGTQIPLWGLGIQNANAKVNALRMGPVDLAITGNYMSLSPSNEGDLSIQYYGVGGYGSLRLLDNWSVHAGGQYAELNIGGVPDFTALSGPIKTFTGLTDDDITEITNAIDESVDYARSEQILSAKIATDIRLNRRDSFIIQGNYMNSKTSDSGLSVEAEGVGLNLESDQISSPLFQYLLVPQESSINYGASLAYQASFKRAYLRLGIGYSTIPYAWLLQSIDLTWRWGGQTKRRANELEKVWELNKKLNKTGGDQR